MPMNNTKDEEINVFNGDSDILGKIRVLLRTSRLLPISSSDALPLSSRSLVGGRPLARLGLKYCRNGAVSLLKWITGCCKT